MEETPSTSEKPLEELTPEELEKEIKKEAENVFRHSAIEFLTKNVPEYDISETYEQVLFG